MRQRLSIVITTYNNESKITATLEAAKWADEIIIVDGHSTDKTVEICKKYTDKVYLQPNHPNWNINKNFGFDKAEGNWILNLDSDEIITSGLKDEILQILTSESGLAYFCIPRREHFFGKWIKSIWGPESLQIKLFRKGTARYECKNPHESMLTKGRKGIVKAHIMHNSYISLKEFLSRTDADTSEEARSLKREGFQLRWWHFISKPGRYVYYALIKQKGYRNGLKEIATIMLWCGYHQFLTLAKLWKIKRS